VGTTGEILKGGGGKKKCKINLRVRNVPQEGRERRGRRKPFVKNGQGLRGEPITLFIGIFTGNDNSSIMSLLSEERGIKKEKKAGGKGFGISLKKRECQGE